MKVPSSKAAAPPAIRVSICALIALVWLFVQVSGRGQVVSPGTGSGGGGGGGTGIQTNGGTGINNSLTNLYSTNAVITNSSFGGVFVEKTANITGSATGYAIGNSSFLGPYSAGSTANQVTLQENWSPWFNDWSVGNGWPILDFNNLRYSSSSGAGYSYAVMPWQFQDLSLDTVSTLVQVPAPGGTVVQQILGNPGALVNFYAHNLGGSSSGLLDQAIDGRQIKNGMLRPVLGITSDSATSTTAAPWPSITNVIQFTNAALYFNTSGIAGTLKSYGGQIALQADDCWQHTNRDANGNLQMIPNLFQGTGSNWTYIIHTNGCALLLAQYFTSREPYQSGQITGLGVGNSDTAYRSDIGGGHENSYPSAQSVASGFYTFPQTTPSTAYGDVFWFYTNGVDGVVWQDLSDYEMEEGYEHQRMAIAAQATLYPVSCLSGFGQASLAYWANLTNGGGGNWGTIGTSMFFYNPMLNHQLWDFQFVNHPGINEQYYMNCTTPDQSPPSVGTDVGLANAGKYINIYVERLTNWDTGVFPLFSLNSLGGYSTTSYSNYYACVGMFNACSFTRETTNMFNGGPLFGGWETNQNPAVTNGGFLRAWQDVEHFPRPFLDDHTNMVFVRSYAPSNAVPGSFLVLALNNSASTTNLNVLATASDSSPYGSIGLQYGVIYAATNVMTGQNLGYVTNNIITNLLASTQTWELLTPVSQTIPLLTTYIASNPTNVAPLGFTSNFTQNTTTVFSNLLGARATAYIGWNGTSGNTGGYSWSQLNLNLTNNGVGTNYAVGFVSVNTAAPSTNQIGGMASFSVGPGDTWKFLIVSGGVAGSGGYTFPDSCRLVVDR